MKIVLDPGHGGRDPGCRGNNLVEKEVVLDLAKRLSNLLRAKNCLCLLTRDTDTYVPIYRRVRLAHDMDAGVLISLHADSSLNPRACGLTAYVVEGDVRSKHLASRILESAHRQIGRLIPNNGVRPDTRTHVRRLGLLRGVFGAMPAVLLECGFLSNSRDAALLGDPCFRQEICTGICNGMSRSTERRPHELAQ